jgi:hypothetical protein
MRRIVTIAVLGGMGYLLVRSGLPKLHERLMARCAGMFEQMTRHASAHGGDEGQRRSACGGGTPSDRPRASRAACAAAPSTEGAHHAA